MIWRLTYCNKNGVEARVDIIKGDRTPVEVVQGSANPFTLSYKLDKNDKSGHIMTSSADIEFFETETFNIDDLKTSNETELKVEYFEGNVLTWSGFILPDFFSKEIGSPNIVRMTASDRLSALKGVTLSDLPIRVSLRDLIELSLDQTGLSLALIAQIQINQGSTNILDAEILSQRLTDVRGRSISCYDILMSIMVGTNSTIRQREGQWVVYNKLEHELRTPSIFFDKVEKGAIRTIQPVASSVGVYNEFGGGRSYPENYDFSNFGLIPEFNFPDWTKVGAFNVSRGTKEIIGYSVDGQMQFGANTVDNYFFNSNVFNTSNYLQMDSVPIPYTSGQIEVSLDLNATAQTVSQFQTNVTAVKIAMGAVKDGSPTLWLNNNGIFAENNVVVHDLNFDRGSVLEAQTKPFNLKGIINNPEGYSIIMRIYGSRYEGEDNRRQTAVHFAKIEFKSTQDAPKGNLYKTTQGSNFTKIHDIETTIFGDFIRNGLNGYFYKYPIDDTSNLYLPNGELAPPQWITAFDTTERPLLHHISRQKSRLFSVAHDILKANINVESFDPLAVFQDCKGGKYVVVSASFDFLRSEVDVELEQIAYDNTILKRDFIYSYFGEGESSITSIGGIISGATSSSSGLSPEQTTILSQVSNLAHLHENKTELDKIKKIIESTDETPLSDENILSSLRVLSEILKNNEAFLEELRDLFLSKVEPDTAQELITFAKGLEVGAFSEGVLGSGAAIKMLNGTSYAEVDHLLVRQKATFVELVIESLKHVGGQLILSPARMKCVDVVDGGSYYKCFFDNDGGAISNEFVAGDQARCQVFTGSGTKFYWRLVTSVGDDWINLSKTDAVSGSDIPEAGDDIVQLGNRNDTTRQSAIILSTIGDDAPSWKQYSGINSFDLANKETTVFTRLGNRIEGKTVFTSGGTNLEDVLDGVSSDIQDTQAAVNNLQIGGRNLLIGSTDAWKTVNAYSYNPYIDIPFNETKLEAGQTYVFSWETELLSGSPTTATQVVLGAGVTSYLRDILWTSRRIIGKQFIVFTPTEANLALGNSFMLRWYTNNEEFSFRYRKLKLEKGNKPTADWTPAPEDVQAEIDLAKQEALTAAGNAQNTANSLKDFTDTAFRDGIIDRSESVAIEKYKNSLNEAMSKAEASYDKVFKNTYLPEGAAKTSLLNAKINLWGQRDTLLSAINTAISGGITTPAQKTAVDNAFSTFNNLMTAFQNALEEANKAIQTKLDDLSTEKVNNIQIGGRNLFSVNDFVADNKARGYSTINVINYNGNIAYRSSSIANNHNIPRYLQGKFEANTQYYLQFKINWESYTDSGAQYVFRIRYTDGTTSNLWATTSHTSRSMLTDSGKTIDYITTTRQHDGTVVIYEVQIEKSNKASDWTPAIEDVQYDINKAMADANLARAVTDKFSGFDGGLATAVIMEMREPSTTTRGDATAGVSGLQGVAKNLPAFWAGGTYEDAIANLAKAIIRHDGTVKFTDAEITGIINALSGSIGDLSLYSGKLSSYDPSLGVVPLGNHIQLSKNEISIRSLSSGNPQILTEASIKNSLITVKSGPLGGPYNSTEIKPDGIYKNGVKVL